ncbi:MAG: helix-turn-helix domain-containing protein [Fusobacterium sp.]|nr:helix-turn-helix domain-containing protein [Fusobacterium sp.]
MSTLSTQVGKRIKELREARNMKQVELAELIDMEATNLSKIEKGVHLPKDESLNKIIQALNVDIQDLFDFGHLKTKKELLKDINRIFEHSTLDEIRFFHKILMSYKELK